MSLNRVHPNVENLLGSVRILLTIMCNTTSAVITPVFSRTTGSRGYTNQVRLRGLIIKGVVNSDLV